jgi:hypothetical protein
MAFFPLLALVTAWLLTLRSLSGGLLSVLTIGYFHGYIRANYLSVYTTFMFDAAILGLYLGFVLGYPRQVQVLGHQTLTSWVALLLLWPSLLVFIPANDFLVQLVALRATVWFVPVMLVASRLSERDLIRLSRGLATLNLLALAGGVYVYYFGVEALYPRNAVTQIIYMSRDIGSEGYHRVPSFFLSAHAYGGTMLWTLPLMVERLFGVGVRWGERCLMAGGLLAAVVGILMCGARLPAALAVLALGVTWCIARFHIGVGLVVVVLAGVGGILLQQNERFQRVLELTDTERVSERVRASANQSFWELFWRYPAGAGLGSAYGTSIPYFLADRAPVAIGMENEFSRLLVDQGWMGLGLWLAFILWLLLPPPPLRLRVSFGLAVLLSYSLVLVSWATAFIGTGMLSSIPGSVLMLSQMGVLARIREVNGQWARYRAG